MRFHTLIVLSLACTASAGEGDVLPFDGATLNGWDGDKSYWTVEDGCIVGRSTPEHPLAPSTYLVWTGDMPQDFDLHCKVKLTGGNSGIHYRSRRVDGQADMAGFQADFDANNSYTGVLYEGLGRELMSARGEQVEFSPAGKRVVAQFAPSSALVRVIRTGGWNDVRIEARGTRVRHWINHVLMSDVTDGDASRFRRDGSLAFQLHQGPPMEVRFRDLVVTPILSAPPAASLTLPPGFTAELLASAQPGQGSWVCIAFDAQGRAAISPQDGGPMMAWIPGVSRNNDASAWSGTTTEVRPLDAPIRGAQGLCFVDGELWVNGAGTDGSLALWRMRDTDANGSFESATCVVPYSGDAGEHGPHAVVKGPDGALYVALGNHTKVPPSIVQYSTDETPGRAAGSPHDYFGEDRIDARMWDPRGHAVGVFSPGGIVLRVNPTAAAAELPTVFAGGFRNAYDHCFNADGELFTYDSDMEWDIGAPWYRAPRIAHVVQGGDYGWRSGSAAMPDWYPDTLPPACETDSASPTGMLAGFDGGFPAPWKNMIFAADWTYGRILAVTLTPTGSTYSASWQPFITGRPMPVADMAWGPDGAMYIVTGGRGTQSGLYRVSATADGSASTSPTAAASAPDMRGTREIESEKLRALRRSIESHTPALGALLELLKSDDRFVQDAARVELEHRPIESWRGLIGALTSKRARLAGSLALVRVGTTDDAKQACEMAAESMRSPDPTNLSDNDAVVAIRIAEIAVARHRNLATEASVLEIAHVELRRVANSPTHDGPPSWIALELGGALGLPATIPLAMAALERAPDRSEALRYVSLLRHVKDGWDHDTGARARYWEWLGSASTRAGGFSLSGFIDHIRADAATTVGKPPQETTATANAPTTSHPAFATVNSTLHDWKVADFEDAIASDDFATSQRDIARGSRIFREATCILCHRFAGDGSTVGPDLTGLGGRFSRRDILAAIVDPSAVVSDQYRDSLIELKDGSIIVGRIVGDSAQSLQVRTNPLTEDVEQVAKSDIASRSEVPTSSMPGNLVSSRTRDEVLDLLAYLLVGSGSAKAQKN